MNIAHLIHAEDRPVFAARSGPGNASSVVTFCTPETDDVAKSGVERSRHRHAENGFHGSRTYEVKTPFHAGSSSGTGCVGSPINALGIVGGEIRSPPRPQDRSYSQARRPTGAVHFDELGPPSAHIEHVPFRALDVTARNVGEVVLSSRRPPSPVAFAAPLSRLDVWYDIVDIFVGLRTPPRAVVYWALGIDPVVRGHGLHALRDTWDGSPPAPMAVILQLALVDAERRCMSSRDLLATLSDHFQYFRSEPRSVWRDTMFTVLEEQWYFRLVPCRPDLVDDDKLWFIDFAAGVPRRLLQELPQTTRHPRTRPDRACETIAADGPRCTLTFSRWNYAMF